MRRSCQSVVRTEYSQRQRAPSSVFQDDSGEIQVNTGIYGFSFSFLKRETAISEPFQITDTPQSLLYQGTAQRKRADIFTALAARTTTLACA